jgi:hypothetical protein
MTSSGFYTNRIRFGEMMRISHHAGFKAQIINMNKWPEAPISKNKLAREFREIDTDDLLISGLDIILKPISS